MTDTGEHETPAPLVEMNRLAERLDNSDVRILDCSVIMNVTENGDHKYSSRSAEWDADHIPRSVFVNILADLGPRYSPAVTLSITGP